MPAYSWCPAILIAAASCCAHPALGEGEGLSREEKIAAVTGMDHFVALWDFVKKNDRGEYIAHTRPDDAHEYALVPRSIMNDFYGGAHDISYDDFPRLGRGPFGQALLFRKREEDPKLAHLMVPRAALHDSPLDIKGAHSVSMVAWIAYESGDHFIAGIWHEGADPDKTGAEGASRGMRQWSLFCGLAANPGAAAVHISENGSASFGDMYARNLAVTARLIPRVSGSPGTRPETLDASWSTVGFVFNHAAHTLTAYLNGESGAPHWIGEDALKKGRFYRSLYRAWRQDYLHSLPVAHPDLDPEFPEDQCYAPPREGRDPTKDKILAVDPGATTDSRTVVKEVTYTFHKERIAVRESRKDGAYIESEILDRDLVGLCVNPYYFPHGIYSPATEAEGGPFTIGKVVTHRDGNGLSGYIGGVAVFDGALSPAQMAGLARPELAAPIALAQAAR